MKWRPLRVNCIVEVEKMEELSKGGIVLPKDMVQKESMAREEGVIIALGPDFDIDSSMSGSVKVGDKVAFARYGGKSLGDGVEGKELRVMRDIDILAVKEEE